MISKSDGMIIPNKSMTNKKVQSVLLKEYRALNIIIGAKKHSVY